MSGEINMNYKQFIFFGLLLALLIQLGGCGEQQSRVADPQTLVIGRSTGFRNLDPAFEALLTDGTVMELAYERLLSEVKKNGLPTGEFKGVLAERWEHDESGLVWTFYLNRDHHFSDGTVVTAGAFKFSVERMLTLQPGMAGNFFWLKEIEVVDDHTLRIHLNLPFPTFLHVLATLIVVVNPGVMEYEHDADMGSAWLSEHSAGSGPYQVDIWERGQRLTMSPNPHAYNKAEYFNKIVFKIIKDDTARRTALKKGAIDIYEIPTAQQMSKFKAMPGISVFDQPGSGMVFLDFNLQNEKLVDVRVRRAIKLAIDYEKLISGILSGYAEPMRGPVLREMQVDDTQLPLPRRDLATAKSLMREAGYPLDEGTKDTEGLSLTLSFLPAGSSANSAALAIQSNLAKIGIDLTLENLAPSAFMSKVTGGEFELALTSFVAAFPDPWLVMFPHFFSKNVGAAGNFARYNNPQVDALLLEAQSTLDKHRRMALYRDAQRQIVDDIPRLFLFRINGLLAFKEELQGLEYSAWRPLVYNVEGMRRVQ